VSVDRVETLRDDTDGGPAALAALLEAYAGDDSPLRSVGEGPAWVVFTGLGSSRYAASTAAMVARSGGLPAWAEYASSSTPTPPAADGALVAISASGRTAETVAGARRWHGQGRVIAVTNDPGSALAAAADVVLPVLAGAEGAGIATRTFRGTIGVLAMLVGAWTGTDGLAAADLSSTVEALRDVMAGRDSWLATAADLLDRSTAIDVLADAADGGLAHQAALMFREAPRIPAVAHDTVDWLHTAVYQAWPGHRALLFSGSAADAEVVATIRRRGGETVVVGEVIEGASLTIETPRLDGPIQRAIVLSVVAEMMAQELWARTSAEDRGES
jgi:glutamine---fructose-6-phosphate transaminase (isomerizing)